MQELLLLKCPFYPKYTVKASPPKIPMEFFTEKEQILLKCVWNHKGPQRAKVTLRKENRQEVSPSQASHCIWGSYSHQNCEELAQKRHTAQGNRTDSAEFSPHGWVC